ncbi:hypothetical protein G9A89_019838 [Geosiphon pyriformis]|nr:hypothetical protein G9A89_019838 [Geosiphon pyriformis]
MSSEDPFFVVKEDVEENMANLSNLFQSWKRIYNTVSSRYNEELQRTEEDLRAITQGITTDLDDLEETINILSNFSIFVQLNPSKFLLTREDLNSRQSFVDGIRQQLKEIQITISAPQKNDRQELFQGVRTISALNDYKSREHFEEIEMDNQRFIENESHQQAILIEEQDGQLESLYGTARNIHGIATTIGNEIDNQNVLLEDFGHHVDDTQSRLNKAMRKVAYIIKKNEESKSTCWITILIAILFILLILVVAI